MSKLQILKDNAASGPGQTGSGSKSPTSATSLFSSPAASPRTKRKYKETLNFVSFHSKVNMRRKWRSKKSAFEKFVDLESDFDSSELNAYTGPRLESTCVVDQGNIDELQQFYVKQSGRLHRKYVYRILILAEQVYRTESTLLLDVNLPADALINICGDIHGQLYDLIKIFKLQGPPSATNYYLFNGDIVDKGQHSIECLLLLLLYKLVYPQWVFINRGNHESALVNVRHGFQKELLQKYPQDLFLFEFFGELFKWIPVAHLINDKIFVIHGGLPDQPDLKIEDIRQKKPPIEAHENEMIAGLLWSDPVLINGISPSTRGIGVFFGPDVTQSFLERNDLKCIIRSHAEVKSGCGLSHANCYTVFSAPFEEKGIMGGLIELRGDTLNLQGNVFKACGQEEAVALLEGNADYEGAAGDGNFNGSKRQVTENLLQ